MKVSDLAYFNFNIFKQFYAQLRRVGNVGQNRDMGLSLLGGESYLPEVVDTQNESVNESSQSSDKEANSNATAEPNSGDDEYLKRDDVDHQIASDDVDVSIGARPKRTVTKPRKFNDFLSYVGSIETLFMAANIEQRKSIISALSLHLEVCTEKCSNHDLFEYLIKQGHTLNEFYGEIPRINKTVKRNKSRPSHVHFDNTVHYSDGSTDNLCCYKVVKHHSKQVLYLSN